jgi:hypothetical protein
MPPPTAAATATGASAIVRGLLLSLAWEEHHLEHGVEELVADLHQLYGGRGRDEGAGALDGYLDVFETHVADFGGLGVDDGHGDRLHLQLTVTVTGTVAVAVTK